MQLYSVKIQLFASKDNEVRKSDVTASEIAVLKRLHGEHSISDIQNVGQVNRMDDTERARLVEIYGFGLAAGKVDTSPRMALEHVLGVEGVPLPQAVPGVPLLPKASKAKKADAPVEEPVAAPANEDEFI